MATKTTKTITSMLGSNWTFAATLLIFAAESGRLAVTSRFPMAFDEAYHFGLIQFFSHRLNPIVTSQTAATYRFGAIIQNPSFLYHYLLSFPYRFVTLFSKSPEVQVASLRLINVALALGSLLVMRKLLRRLHVSDSLANLLILVFALTPIVTVLSAQINYDNLFTLAVALVIYQTVRFSEQLGRKTVDIRALLSLVCLCLFSSLVKFAFLPILLAVTVIICWQLAAYARRHGRHRLLAAAKTGFARIGNGAKLGLLTAILIGGFLFLRLYSTNLVRYRNPVPQCNQVLSIRDCQHYYAWESNYATQQYERLHPAASKMSASHYTLFWLRYTAADLYGEIMPLQGPYYLSPVFYPVVILLAATTLVCTAITFRKVMGRNRQLVTLAVVSFVYLFFLWTRNYHDYLQLGQPVAINGRYWVAVLMYLYILLGLGVQAALPSGRPPAAIAKAALAVVVICSFICYGGDRQYVAHISPLYGQLSPTNDFVLPDFAPSNSN